MNLVCPPLRKNLRPLQYSSRDDVSFFFFFFTEREFASKRFYSYVRLRLYETRRFQVVYIRVKKLERVSLTELLSRSIDNYSFEGGKEEEFS